MVYLLKFVFIYKGWVKSVFVDLCRNFNCINIIMDKKFYVCVDLLYVF